MNETIDKLGLNTDTAVLEACPIYQPITPPSEQRPAIVTHAFSAASDKEEIAATSCKPLNADHNPTNKPGNLVELVVLYSLN